MAGIAYLNQHQITPVLNAAVNDLAREAPAEPFDFLINALLKAAKARGVETALEQRLKSIQSTLTQEQAEAQREIAVLKKRVAELEGGGGGGGGGAPVAGNVKISYPPKQVQAWARQAQYFTKEERIVLTGDVDVLQAGGNRLKAERITYLVLEDRMIADPAPGDQVFSNYRIQRTATLEASP